MRTSRRSRTLTSRLAALSAAVGAAALVGLGATGAHAAPTTTRTAPTATAATRQATPAASTTTTATSTTATTTAATTTAATTTATTTTEATGSPAPTSTGPRNAPGPPCPGVTSVLTPVLCIPTGSGEDQPAPIGTDGFLEFAGQVVNNGPAVTDATLVITLPTGLQLDPDSDVPIGRLDLWWSTKADDDSTPLDCTSDDGLVYTCATGAVPTGANFLVFVEIAAQDDAVAGTSGTLRMRLQSTPTPGTFPTTSVDATVDFVGTAHLQVSLTPIKASVTVGKSLTLVATVHNVGPNTAVEAGAVGFTFPDDFGDDYTFLITNSAPLPGDGGPSAALARSNFLLRALPAKASARTSGKRASTKKAAVRTAVVKPAAAETPSPIGFWPIGTIAAGATASVQIVVKAVAVGHVELNFFASSADESCDDESNPDCENTATAELTAVAAVTTTATTAPATTVPSTTVPSTSAAPVSAVGSSASAAALPNTGFEPTPWLGSAAAVILLGVGLMMLGAPRRRVCGGGHR